MSPIICFTKSNVEKFWFVRLQMSQSELKGVNIVTEFWKWSDSVILKLIQLLDERIGMVVGTQSCVTNNSSNLMFNNLKSNGICLSYRWWLWKGSSFLGKKKRKKRTNPRKGFPRSEYSNLIFLELELVFNKFTNGQIGYLLFFIGFDVFMGISSENFCITRIWYTIFICQSTKTSYSFCLKQKINLFSLVKGIHSLIRQQTTTNIQCVRWLMKCQTLYHVLCFQECIQNSSTGHPK